MLVGGIINSLLRNSARVRVGCLAQLVNVIAPIMTKTDRFYRQTTFYPYMWALKYARGAALDALLDPDHPTKFQAMDRFHFWMWREPSIKKVALRLFSFSIEIWPSHISSK